MEMSLASKTKAENPELQYGFTLDEIETIKKTVAVGATDAQLKLFLIQCKRTGLDPFSRQIYCFIKGGKLVVMSAIDGLRVVAERSGKYEGQTPTQWCGPDGLWKDVWLDSKPPMAAKVGVYRQGFREPLFAIALTKEYSPSQNMWTKMPSLMIGKVAESLALRKAFPNDLSGIYTQEEMDQAGFSESSVKDVTPAPAPVIEQVKAEEKKENPWLAYFNLAATKFYDEFEVGKEKLLSICQKRDESDIDENDLKNLQRIIQECRADQANVILYFGGIDYNEHL